MKTLDGALLEVSREAKAYPVHRLYADYEGLCLFAAAFLGENDAIHMARMGMRADCVDVNATALEQMREIYPSDWNFVHRDAWAFATEAFEEDHSWDVVSVDTFTGDATDRSLKTLDLWCAIARHMVTATIASHTARPDVPGGWVDARYNRSTLADWLVLTRA